MSNLIVTSIFTSIDGEVNAFGQGRPTTFIRLAGCNLRCWRNRGGCDTPHSIESKFGREMTVDQIISKVNESGMKKVTITGGEPLLQREALGPLLLELDRNGIDISIETNGTFLPDCEGHWAVGSWIYDHKCPSTGETDKMIPLIKVYNRLTELDYIKFVIADGDDYLYAADAIQQLPERPTAPILAFSAMAGGISPADLVRRMLDDKLSHVIFNLQIHKYIWPSSTVER